MLYWLRRSLLSGVAGVLITLQVSVMFFAANARNRMAFDAQSGADFSSESKDLDAIYHGLLHDFDVILAEWRKTPGDLPAFRSHLNRVGEQIAALRSRLPNSRSSGNSSAPQETSKQSTTNAPSGPVQPSQVPSSPEDVERRRKATEERFPSVHIGNSRDKSLAGVPASRIKKSCIEAQKTLKTLEKLLKKDPPDYNLIDASLQRLRSILYNLDDRKASEGAIPAS